MTAKNDAGPIANVHRDLDATMSEAAWQLEVIDYAKGHGWICAHFRPARTEKGWRTAMQGDPGYPDLTLARRGVVLMVELKRVGGKPSTNQRYWLEASNGYCWTPADRAEMQVVLK